MIQYLQKFIIGHASKLIVNIAFSIDHALLEIPDSFEIFETFIRIFDSEPAGSRHGSQTLEGGSQHSMDWNVESLSMSD